MPPDGTQGMVAFDAAALDGTAAYKLVSGAVIPRPIAWVSSLNEDGSVNLAPFSSYIFLTYDPPKIGISIGPGVERLKDTLRNIIRTRNFVVNSVSPEQLSPMVETSRRYPAETSEAADLGIPLSPSHAVATPRVAGSDVALECVLDRVIELGDRDAHRLVIGRVATFQIAGRVLRDGRIDPSLYRPIGRIGGPHYVMPGELRRAQPTQDDRFA